jgi:hypothetical protein
MLIAEDDTVPEVWFLLGLALHAGGEFDDALTAANEAERLVTLRRHEDPAAGETLLDIEDLRVYSRQNTCVQNSCKDPFHHWQVYMECPWSSTSCSAI